MKKIAEGLLIGITVIVIIVHPFFHISITKNIPLEEILPQGMLILLGFFYIGTKPERDPVIIHLIMIAGLVGSFLFNYQIYENALFYRLTTVSMIAASYLCLTSNELDNHNKRDRNLITAIGIGLFFHGGFSLMTMDILQKAGHFLLYGLLVAFMIYFILMIQYLFIMQTQYFYIIY